jgi:hypothetical protein
MLLWGLVAMQQAGDAMNGRPEKSAALISCFLPDYN